MTLSEIPAPLRVRRTGDDTPAASVWGYIRRMGGRSQIGAILLAVLTAALGLAPVEIQRRIVDDAIGAGDLTLLLILGGLWLGTLFALQGAKFGLGVWQGWLTESAAAYTRRHLLGLRPDGDPGERVAITGAEVDKLAGFAGTGPSGAAASAALLLGGAAWMFIADPRIALAALALLLPQALAVPMLQRRLNVLTSRQLRLVRRFGRRVTASEEVPNTVIGALYRNRMRFTAWKFALKAVLNLLNGLAPLGVLVIGGWLAIEGETTLGVLVGFVSALDRMSAPIRQLVTFYRQAAEAQVRHAMIAKWM